MPEQDDIPIEDRFHFDLSGFVQLKSVLTPETCESIRNKLYELEKETYDDVWIPSLGEGRPPKPTLETNHEGQVRLNGLPRLDSIFDQLIDNSRVLPYLKAFVGDPQLINTWSISKSKGAQQGGWHHGVPASDYSYRNGDIRSRMLNVVFFLTNNGPDDGCLTAVPGSHKSNFELKWQSYRGLDLPGSLAVTGSAGDVFMFSEAVVHNGLKKTTDGIRTNLYYNYVHAHYNVMNREPRNCHHFYFPPEIRERFNETQRSLTQWMELVKWDY